MLENNIIEYSDSDFLNPLVTIIKKNGDVRICLDARDLNRKLKMDFENAPSMDEVLTKCTNTKFMSSWDLRTSFLQIELAPESRKYTAFLWEGKVFHFCRVPYGTRVSGAALCRGTRIAFDKLDNFLIGYVDDFLCLSDSFQNHLKNLDKFFKACKKHNLTLNFKKANICREEINFLGLKLTADGLTTDPEKLDKIQNFPKPKNIKQLRGFLGLINFFHKFSEKIAEYFAPLLQLLKKNQKWKWTDEHTKSFNNVKNLFIKEITIHFPFPNRPFFLYCDSNDDNVAGVLCQYSEDSQLKIISCTSRTLKNSEKSYTTTEKELLSIIHSLIKFRTYLLGNKTVIKTDHKAITFLKTCPLINQRLTRWFLFLQNYDIDIEHISGKENFLADLISRTDYDVDKDNKNNIPFAQILADSPSKDLLKNLKNIDKLQDEDKYLNAIKTSELKTLIKRKYTILNNTLYKSNKVVLPDSIIKNIVTQTHHIYAHIGAFKCFKMLEEAFYFKNMRHRIAQILKTCDPCQRNKHNNQNSFADLQSITPYKINQYLSIDFCGPYCTSIGGSKYILSAVDCFSKHVALFSVKRPTTEIVLKRLINDYFIPFGKPDKIIMDNASQFRSPKFTKKLQELNVKPCFVSLANAKASPVERIHRSLNQFFRAMIKKKHTEWAKYVPIIAKIMNETYHSTHEYTPLEIHLNKKPTRFWDKYIIMQNPNDTTYETKLFFVENRIKNKSSKRNKKINDAHKNVEYNINDLVLVKAQNVSDAFNKICSKFLALYHGPYVIQNRLNSVYTLFNPITKTERGKYHCSFLKKYHGEESKEAKSIGTPK